jgi:hypothetical protein
MTGKLSKEEAAELRHLSDDISAATNAVYAARNTADMFSAVQSKRIARAAFERRLAELTEG